MTPVIEAAPSVATAATFLMSIYFFSSNYKNSLKIVTAFVSISSIPSNKNVLISPQWNAFATTDNISL